MTVSRLEPRRLAATATSDGSLPLPLAGIEALRDEVPHEFQGEAAGGLPDSLKVHALAQVRAEQPVEFGTCGGGELRRAGFFWELYTKVAKTRISIILSDSGLALKGEAVSRHERSPALLAQASHRVSALLSPVAPASAHDPASGPDSLTSAVCVACSRIRSSFR